MNSETVVVIGGGVIGLSTAYQLKQKGVHRVVLIDKGTVGDGASRRAAGIGNHLLWTETGVRARQISFKLFRQFSEEWDDYTFHNEHGCLNLFTPQSWAKRAALLPLYQRLNASFEILDAEEMSYRWPVINPLDDMIGLFDPHGGYSEPDEYISALLRHARQLGIEIYQQERVVEFTRKSGHISGVRTPRQLIEADAVVSTVHVWSLPLWNELNLRLPMKHFVHQRYVTTSFQEPVVAPALNADPYLGYLRPAAGKRILMGVETPDGRECRVETADFDMHDLTTMPSVRDDARDRFSSLVPLLKNASWETERIGLISFTSDGEPILGPVRNIPGLFVAASFHSGGYSYSPVAGLLMAQLVVDGQTSIDISTFSPDRFCAEETECHLAETILQSQAIRRRH